MPCNTLLGVLTKLDYGRASLSQGPPPRTLLINGSPVRVVLQPPHGADVAGMAARSLRCAAFTQPLLLVSLLRLMQGLVGNLRVDVASHRRDVRWGVSWLREIATVLAEPPICGDSISSRSIISSPPSDAEVRSVSPCSATRQPQNTGTQQVDLVRMLRTRRRLHSDLMQLLNDVEDTRLFAAATTASTGLAQAPFLAHPSQLKYGARALRRVAKGSKGGSLSVPVPIVLRSLVRSTEGLTVAQLALSTGISSMASPLHGHEGAAARAIALGGEARSFALTALALKRPVPSAAISLLYSIGMVGVQLRMGRSEASTINPWMIRVEYLARSRADTATALCALDAGHRLKDSTGEEAPEVCGSSFILARCMSESQLALPHQPTTSRPCVIRACFT